ncbi:MAG TPA: DNA polymerase III subunit beta [Ignavibacteriales bacterium]|nr:DNA polymerase III subunit beta [Ignavibacteriales bacterium]
MLLLKSELERALRATKRNLGSAIAVHILGTYLFKESKDTLTIRTGNLTSSTKTTIKIGQGEEKEYCVPARLYDLLSLLPDLMLNVRNEGGKLVIRHGKSEYRLPILSGDEFPADIEKDPAQFEIELEAKDYLDKLQTVEVAAAKAKDDARGFDALYYEIIDNQMVLTATDTMILSTTNISQKYPVETVNAIVTKESSDILKAVLLEAKDERVTLRIASKTVELETPGVTFITLKSSTKVYPDYRKVIPQLNNIMFTIDREKLLEVLSRLIRINERKQVKFTMKGNSVIVSGYEIGEEKIPGTLEGASEFEFYANPEKMKLVMMTHKKPEVTIRLKEAHKPILIVDDHLSLIMPVRGEA